MSLARKVSSARSSPMIERVPVTKARSNLGGLLDRLRTNREYFVIEKDGIPVAGLMDIDEFEDYLELQDPSVRAIIQKGRQEYVAGRSRPADELLRELRQPKRGRATRRRSG